MFNPCTSGGVPQVGVAQSNCVRTDGGVERTHPFDAWKRRFKLGHTLPYRRNRPNGIGGAGDERFDRGHHVAVVRERLIEFQHRELRIVRPVHAFVAEVMSDLVHPLEAADNQSLEIQFVGHSQVQRHVERVMVRGEWTRQCAAIQRLKHRRLHLQVAAPIQKCADCRNHPGAGDEDGPHFGMYGEISVALPVALLGI